MDKRQICSITPSSLDEWEENSIAIAAHDAGAAHHILNWVRPLEKKLKFHLGGPAIDIFKKEFPELKNHDQIDNCLEKTKLLISGTGWSSNLEHNARVIASNQRIASIAVLDHWVNYDKRFTRNNTMCMPDMLWVSDEEAQTIARKTFPSIPIKTLDNKWLNNIRQEFDTYRKQRSNSQTRRPAINILFLLEPHRNKCNGEETHDKFGALDNWLDEIPTLIKAGLVEAKGLKIRMRLHPSEKLNKYDKWIDKNSKNWSITKDNYETLAESLANSDVAIGCETQALVAAITCNIKAISCIPKGWSKCRLPHKGIIHINQIKE